MNKECTVDVIKVIHDTREDFALCLYQRTKARSTLYFVFLFALLAYDYALVIWLICVSFLEPELKINTFLHAWASFIHLFATEHGVFYLIQYPGPQVPSDGLSLFRNITYKIYWLSLSASLPLLALSFISFWSKAFDGMNVPIDIVMCNVTPLLCVYQFFLVSFPLRLCHALVFDIFAFVYVFFTLIYQECGGRGRDDKPFIYKYLDWDSYDDAAFTFFICIVIGNAIYVIFWLIKMQQLRCRDRYAFEN